MPLKKILLRPGINRENTRYTNEGGYYDCDKIRFRQGTPEKIGGWQSISENTFLGVCRSLWPWSILNGAKYLGTGTNLKYYISETGTYYDITPIRDTTAPGAVTFAAVTIAPYSSTITVSDTAHGCVDGDFVTFSGVASPGGLGGNITEAVLEQEYQITYVDANSYTITAKSPTTGLPVLSNASDTGNGGAAVVGAYQINVGSVLQSAFVGWGAGTWGGGGWGVGTASVGNDYLRVWNAANFGEDLIYGPSGGTIYYWDATTGTGSRGVAVSSLSGASDVPLFQNQLLVSDTSRFVLAFATNDYGASTQDPMLIRWSDQESAVNWTPAATNQAGSIRLSHGSEIVSALQVRQEILVWTDTSLYSMQYLGPPVVWGTQLLADNLSIVSDRAAAVAAGVTYWMGYDKFYAYDGRVQTLTCDLQKHVFDDFNIDQQLQVFATTVQKFNEVWWFYCSANSTAIDRYVVFNYIEKVWYYGTLARTAWIDSSVVSHNPIAAGYAQKLLYQEYGVDDNTTVTPAPITAFITSAEFDIEDGNDFGFIWRVLPDITFRGSTAANPQVTMYLLPLQNSGSGYNDNSSTNANQSVAGTSYAPITRTATLVVEEFTGQINTRVRGRQMSIKIESTELGVQWQLGAPRIDIRPDGRR
jgi:hypothetical protein